MVLADVLAWVGIASYKPLMTQLLKPGLTIADYEIIELVGQGGMGEVYRAKQLSMDRIVAIKTLAPHLARKDPIFAKRFVEEARAAGRLNHANIVAVHDVDLVTIETPEGPHEVDFFSMEFIAGESVKDVIERDGACKLSLVELVMRGMAEALIYAESQRVIHRDIKPDNIMITNAGEVKLADLGLAVQAGDDSVSEERDERGRAKVMGTPLYMSPEQARALPLDPRSDQYSLGATLFHMLTGQTPFCGEDSRSVMKAHVFSPVPDPAALRPELPEGWCRLCCRLMAKKPEERFLDASDMKRVIEAVIAGRDEEIDQQPQPEALPEAKKNSSFALVVGIILVVLAPLAYLAIEHVSATSATSPANVPSSPQSRPDPQLDIERRIKDAIAKLPAEDPVAGLVIVERLAADPANKPALPYLDQASSLLKIAIEANKLKVIEERAKSANKKLDAVQEAMEAGHLRQARVLLEAIGDLPEAAIPRRDAVLKLCQEAMLTKSAVFVKRLAEVQDDEAFSQIKNDLAISELGEAERTKITEALVARREALKSERNKKSQAEELNAWRALAESIEVRRCSALSAKDLEALISAQQARLSSPEALVLLKSLQEAGPLLAKIEAALKSYAESRPAPGVEGIFDGKFEKGVLQAVDGDRLTLAIPRPGSANALEPRAFDRRKAVISQFPTLIKNACKNARLNLGADENRIMAAYLWLHRSLDTKNDLKALAEDPLAKSIMRLEMAMPRADLRVPLLYNGKRITAQYIFKPVMKSQLDDFVGTSLDVIDDALRWTVTETVPVNKSEDASLPTLRWKLALRLPSEFTARLKLSENNPAVFVGFDSGERRVGIAVMAGRNDVTLFDRLGIVCTDKEGKTIQLPLKGNTRWAAKSNLVVQVKLWVDENGQMSGLVDDKVKIAATPETALPKGVNLVPVIRLLPTKASPSITVDVQSLTITGEIAAPRLK